MKPEHQQNKPWIQFHSTMRLGPGSKSDYLIWFE